MSYSVPFVRGSTRVVGVFGYPVEHSLSPAMHNAAFAALQIPYIYVPFPVAPQALGTAIRSLYALGIVGVNLTIPHKEAVLPFLDEITPEAREIGAVNTVHAIEGRLLGDNTDGVGFYAPLQELGIRVAGQQVVVLGAGGSARAVVFRLVREGARVLLVNRNPESAERLARAVAEAGYGDVVRTQGRIAPEEWAEWLAGSTLLVNTTPVGMHPHEDAMPAVPLEAFHSDLRVYDLIYNPVETVLLREARLRGCRTLAGVKMLVSQGAAAFQRWTGLWPPTDVMESAVLEGLRARNSQGT
ncbi:MAG TPA: shikimate dehydrogenase [Chthonomonadaceae bacterium]|nr:shikimate dehydrogenase [Chthonomonadaceae bacterium]